MSISTSWVAGHPRLALAGVANGPLNAGRLLAQHVRLQPETNRVLHCLERAFLEGVRRVRAFRTTLRRRRGHCRRNSIP